jgi:hypothetical protein
MAIDRTKFNKWVDDDGSGLTGTILNKTRMDDDILDPIDAELARLDGALAGTIAPGQISPVQASRLLGRSATGAGDAEELAIGAGLELQGATLVATAQNSGLYGYGFSVQTTEPPSARTARLNAPHPYTASTKLWITFQNSNSEDLYFEWMGVPVGSVLLVQDKDTHGQFAELTVTAPPIDKGTYCEFPVAWKANGTALATQDCLVRTHLGGALAALEARIAALEARR